MATQKTIKSEIDELLRDWVMPEGDRYQIYIRSRKNDAVSSIAQAVWSVLEEDKAPTEPRLVDYNEVRNAVAAFQADLSKKGYDAARGKLIKTVVRRPITDSQEHSIRRKDANVKPLKQRSKGAIKETQGDMQEANDLAQDREIYELWYEYLKRSGDYGEFCEWMRQKRKNKNIPVPEKFKKDEMGGAHIVVSIFLRWHDVHMWPFDTIWDHFLKVEQWNDDYWKDKPDTSIKYYPYFVQKDLDCCIESFRTYENREPTAEELRDYFLQILGSDEGRGIITLRVSTKSSMESLKQQFVDVIKSEKRKRVYPWKGCSWLGKPIEHPLCLTKNNYQKDLPSLRRYLRAYDLHQDGLTIFDIVRQLGKERYSPYDAGDDDKDMQDSCRRDIKKAERIIRNAEQGFFPGEYDHTQARRRVKASRTK